MNHRKYSLKLVDITTLKPHEKTDKKRLKKLLSKLRREKVLRNPVVVEKETKVILDGHHRVEAFRNLKLKRIPAILVDYNDIGVKVFFRRKELLMKIIKKTIISQALKNKTFPYKTTRHYIPNRLKNINFSIKV